MTDNKPDWASEIATEVWSEGFVRSEAAIAAALRKAKADGFRMCKKAMLGERIGPVPNELNSMADEIERGEAPWHGGKWLGRDNT